MTPFSFEWAWNIDHMIFLGLLYFALAVIGAGLGFVVIKTVIQLLGLIRERHF